MPYPPTTDLGLLSRIDGEAGVNICWPWLGTLDTKGYGIFRRNYKTRFAHRWAYEYFYGVNPGKLVVRHSCDNPRCCNPNHLSVGTQRDNILDMVKRGRWKGGPPKQYKITKIKELRSKGMLLKDIAATIGCGISTVSRYLNQPSESENCQ